MMVTLNVLAGEKGFINFTTKRSSNDQPFLWILWGNILK